MNDEIIIETEQLGSLWKSPWSKVSSSRAQEYEEEVPLETSFDNDTPRTIPDEGEQIE